MPTIVTSWPWASHPFDTLTVPFAYTVSLEDKGWRAYIQGVLGVDARAARLEDLVGSCHLVPAAQILGEIGEVGVGRGVEAGAIVCGGGHIRGG